MRHQREKDVTRLMQGVGLVISRMVELRTAQSAGMAAEERWNNAAAAAAAGLAPIASSRTVPHPPPPPPPHAPPAAGLGTSRAMGGEPVQQGSDDAAARRMLQEALASERRARAEAEEALREERIKMTRMEEQVRARVGVAASAEQQQQQQQTSIENVKGAESMPTDGEHNRQASPEAAAVRQPDEAQQHQQQLQAKETAPEKKAAASIRRESVRESSVTTSPLMRVAQFGFLGVGMGVGVIGEAVKRTMNGTVVSGGGLKGMVLGGANSDRLTETLCRMRGAALKLGQLLSIQDEHVIPKDSPLRAVIDRVREEAEHMPSQQLSLVMEKELGSDWRDKFREFDDTPFAAASIGQVHRAVTHGGDVVAVKVQYPGVAQSIDADIGTLGVMLAPLAPRGMFLSTALEELRVAMKNECDYIKEAEMTRKMRSFLEGDATFGVPRVFSELSTRHVMTTEMLSGVPIDQVAGLDQKTRDAVALGMMRLTLKELFVFNVMQTDPNWSNFLYDQATGKINLIDFGAAVEYPREFCVNYGRLVKASADQDRKEIIRVSREMGFLTGEETSEFLEAHASAAMITGEPFRGGTYDFGTCAMTERNSGYIATMLAGRKTAPPRQVYTLHRKLSGAFLSSIKLKAKIECKSMFAQYLPAA